jgi:hypothetical protein
MLYEGAFENFTSEKAAQAFASGAQVVRQHTSSKGICKAYIDHNAAAGSCVEHEALHRAFSIHQYFSGLAYPGTLQSRPEHPNVPRAMQEHFVC